MKIIKTHVLVLTCVLNSLYCKVPFISLTRFPVINATKIMKKDQFAIIYPIKHGSLNIEFTLIFPKCLHLVSIGDIVFFFSCDV